jgi:hypothetical protein
MISLLITLALGIARALGVKSEPFQAMAHVWVGWLIGRAYWEPSRMAGWLAVILTVLEVIVFLTSPKRTKTDFVENPDGLP